MREEELQGAEGLLLPSELRRTRIRPLSTLCGVYCSVSRLWDIAPCCPFKVNTRFGGIGRLHLQGIRTS